jgi:cytoskeletal protein RodZ
MIPALLDALTIFFIVVGLALLWLNLRVRRRRTVPKTLPEQAEHVAGMSNTDLATSRARAEECLELAAQSTSQTDKEIWLQIAEKWIKLVEDAERGRSIK